MIKAYAITTIHRRDKKGKEQIIPASTLSKVSVFNVDQKEFDDLAALNGVREATAQEIALAKVQAEQSGNAAFEDEAVDGDDVAETATSKKPNSGAAGDPSSTPKKSAKSDSKDDDLNL